MDPGGDGPKRIVIEEMRENHSLQERVQMLGTVPHHKVRDVSHCAYLMAGAYT